MVEILLAMALLEKQRKEKSLKEEAEKRNKEKTEDAEFEIIDTRNCVFDVKRIDDRLKELGALQDIDHEIIEPKQLPEPPNNK